MPNCKQGDLAIVVHSQANNHGKIVRCLEFSPNQQYKDWENMDSWAIDPPLPNRQGSFTPYIPDAWLKPLPPLDESDDAVEKKELVHHD